jgi:hypothetical protein
MPRDDDLKFDFIDLNDDSLGALRDAVAAEDPRELPACLLSFIVIGDDGSVA